MTKEMTLEELYDELRGLMDSLDEHIDAGTVATALRELALRVYRDGLGEPADHWKQAASTFPLRVPVDGQVVALVRLPLSVTALYGITTVLDNHLGPDLVFRTDTGLTGWAVIASPSPVPSGPGAGEGA